MTSMDGIRDIENRPQELFTLPHYRDLPKLPIAIERPSASSDFLEQDLLTLDGIQPIEMQHIVASDGIITTNPSENSIEIYRNKNARFQLVHIVVNCYQFTESDGCLVGKPYNISLQPAIKHGEVETVGIDWIEKANIETLQNSPQLYKGFNPFVGAYGFYMIGAADISNIESDMLGFVKGMYFLSTSFDHDEVLVPFGGEMHKNPQVVWDYSKYRKKRYFKPFTKAKPKRIWGCDSPIELFLLQAMGSIGLNPELQTMICADGSTISHIHALWENNKARRKLKVITETDFYFPHKKLAVFCDSIAHHSSSEAIKKDAEIDRKLNNIGIQSLRIRGTEIASSPINCARKVERAIENIA